ncbi:hypothetical protein RvY_16814 [Ramazzottius varieornatus]|uniref:Uncharacterized protein n=1 Tax=Ramazzottius varieornatus TaxID=947166 RepID=A0A1D1W640_RAMVA|nr:hypothetical protein RvY_16814 [Ramazzottius varieornatus]
MTLAENVAVKRKLNDDDDDCQIIKIVRRSSSVAVKHAADEGKVVAKISGYFGGGLTWEEEQDVHDLLEQTAKEDARSQFAAKTMLSFDRPSTSRDPVVNPRISRLDISPSDPDWETIDPTPDIQAMFQDFNGKYVGES